MVKKKDDKDFFGSRKNVNLNTGINKERKEELINSSKNPVKIDDKPRYYEKFIIQHKDELKPKVKTKTTTLYLEDEILALVNDEVEKDSNLTINAIINQFLEQYYNPDLDKFMIDVPAKEKKVEFKGIPIKAPINALNALKVGAKERNMKIGEYFTEMFKKAMK